MITSDHLRKINEGSCRRQRTSRSIRARPFDESVDARASVVVRLDRLSGLMCSIWPDVLEREDMAIAGKRRGRGQRIGDGR